MVTSVIACVPQQKGEHQVTLLNDHIVIDFEKKTKLVEPIIFITEDQFIQEREPIRRD